MPLYIQLLHLALMTELKGVIPIVVVLLVVGLGTAIFQSALQIEDATFSLLPKIFAMIAIGLLGGFGAMGVFENLAYMFISHTPFLIRQSWS